MSYYVYIRPRHRPFPLPGLDEQRRVTYSINFEALAVKPVDKWEEEVTEILSDAGLITPNVDAFIGVAVNLPALDMVLQIISTGGKENRRSNGDDGFERPTVQVLVHGKDDLAASEKALAVWRLLDSVKNREVVVP